MNSVTKDLRDSRLRRRVDVNCALLPSSGVKNS